MISDRHWIGGSNAAGILGISPYRTPLQEYLAMTGQPEPETAEREAFFRRRKALEPFAVDLFEQETGLAIARVNERHTDSDHSFIRAEIDAETTGGANLEIKTVNPFAAKDWGESGTDQIPVYVTAQAMHGLMVTNRQLCHVLALIGFDDVRIFSVARDEETIAALRAREVEFWTAHVVPRIAPEPSNASDVLRLFARDSGDAIEATSEIIDTLNQLRTLKASARHPETLIALMEEQIKLFMRGHAVLTANGAPLATWKSQGCTRFDQKAFGAAHPELLNTFKVACDYRVLRIRK